MTTGEQLYPERNHNLAVETTARLISLLDAYGHEGQQLVEPGLIRRAGFLTRAATYTFATSHATIVSEWVDMQHFGHGSTFQIDTAAHLTSPNITTVIDCYTDDETLENVLKYDLCELSQQEHEAYDDPANIELLVSLFDPVAHRQKIDTMKPPGRRELRSQRKAIEKDLINQGAPRNQARGIAHLAISRYR